MAEPKLICGMNYIPYTELRVPATNIVKAKFPVTEAHGHLGSLVLGENYDTLYDMDETVEKMKSYGITKMINLDGFWGEELDRMMAKTEQYNDDFGRSNCGRRSVWYDGTKKGKKYPSTMRESIAYSKSPPSWA